MEKEIVTRERIKRDLNVLNIYNIKLCILVIAFSLFLILISFIIPDLQTDFSTITLIAKVFIYGILSIAILLFVSGVCVICSCTIKIKRNNNVNYRVVKDKLTNKLPKQHGGRSLFTKAEPYRLYFSFNSEWQIYNKYYTWSKNSNISDEGLYEYWATIGDEFYLVKNAKNEIIMAYNCKLFELSSDLKLLNKT